MKKYNVIVVFNKDLTKTLMCKRTKEPYKKNMYNLVGGKIEKKKMMYLVKHIENYMKKQIFLRKILH
ncbi:MAG: hypothetical protein L6V81_00790 [Clostridium sp.]|nr:MAG: hypothetical protein L6V81_00790 [Clostridium sp.]